MRKVRTKKVICLKGTYSGSTFVSDDGREFTLCGQFTPYPQYGYFELHDLDDGWYRIIRKVILELS